MNSNHTPGPWILSTVNAGPIHGMKYELSTKERLVTSPFAAMDANAKLIAAAPDMAEALRTIALHAPSLDAQGVRDICDAALAKAGL